METAKFLLTLKQIGCDKQIAKSYWLILIWHETRLIVFKTLSSRTKDGGCLLLFTLYRYWIISLATCLTAKDNLGQIFLVNKYAPLLGAGHFFFLTRSYEAKKDPIVQIVSFSIFWQISIDMTPGSVRHLQWHDWAKLFDRVQHRLIWHNRLI